jgi:hypothetical protein
MEMRRRRKKRGLALLQMVGTSPFLPSSKIRAQNMVGRKETFLSVYKRLKTGNLLTMVKKKSSFARGEEEWWPPRQTNFFIIPPP